MGKNDNLIEVKDLKKWFYPKQSFISKKKDPVRAVDKISFSLKKGDSVGIAGESGCGKSTTGRLLLNLLEPTSGSYTFNNIEMTEQLSKEDLAYFRRNVQLMFQNPFEAMNPRFTIFQSLEEPLIIHDIGTKEERRERVIEMLEKVNLSPVERYMYSYPHQLSGGQLQRAVLARALIIDPLFLVADEPVSMLDVSVRAGVLNLMDEIASSMNLTTVYISHDLSLIKYLCNQTMIMYLGAIMEKGPTEKILFEPKHPYTRVLIDAVPSTDPFEELKELNIKQGIGSAIQAKVGCKFKDRCPFATDKCLVVAPELQEVDEDHFVACHYANEI